MKREDVIPGEVYWHTGERRAVGVLEKGWSRTGRWPYWKSVMGGSSFAAMIPRKIMLGTGEATMVVPGLVRAEDLMPMEDGLALQAAERIYREARQGDASSALAVRAARFDKIVAENVGSIGTALTAPRVRNDVCEGGHFILTMDEMEELLRVVRTRAGGR